jgi:hypothetical protein
MAVVPRAPLNQIIGVHHRSLVRQDEPTVFVTLGLNDQRAPQACLDIECVHDGDYAPTPSAVSLPPLK